MIKCTLIIPMAYNDGEWIRQHIFDGYFDKLAGWFGGFTVSEVTGQCRMENGQIKREYSKMIMVVCEREGLRLLRGLAATVACELRQESVYLDWHEVNVEFITADGVTA